MREIGGLGDSGGNKSCSGLSMSLRWLSDVLTEIAPKLGYMVAMERFGLGYACGKCWHRFRSK